MGRFFSMDNKFFTFMNKVADLCILNIICLVCCIPIVPDHILRIFIM